MCLPVVYEVNRGHCRVLHIQDPWPPQLLLFFKRAKRERESEATNPRKPPTTSVNYSFLNPVHLPFPVCSSLRRSLRSKDNPSCLWRTMEFFDPPETFREPKMPFDEEDRGSLYPLVELKECSTLLHRQPRTPDMVRVFRPTHDSARCSFVCGGTVSGRVNKQVPDSTFRAQRRMYLDIR